MSKGLVLDRPPPAGFPDFWRNRPLRAMALTYLLVWTVAAIRPLDRQDWFLENILVFAALPAFVLFHRHRLLSNGSYLLLLSFLTLHAIGAHFTYSEMPLGNALRNELHWSRNHYDRLVHFSFGLLITPPLRQILAGRGIRPLPACVLAIHVAMAWSGLYEIAEALVAHVVSPELGATFNGIQGDIWDAQKDMSLAFGGAVVAMILHSALRRPFRPAAHA